MTYVKRFVVPDTRSALSTPELLLLPSYCCYFGRGVVVVSRAPSSDHSAVLSNNPSPCSELRTTHTSCLSAPGSPGPSSS